MIGKRTIFLFMSMIALSTAIDPDNICILVKDGTKIVDETSCAGFYTCKSGKATASTCSSGYFFEKNIQACVPQSQASCKSSQEAPCAGVEDGKFVAMAGSCSGYYYCKNQIGSAGECPNNLNFNPEKQQCMYKNEYTCTIAGGSGNTNAPNDDPEVLCAYVPEGMFFGNAASCSTWHKCKDNKIITGACKNLVFNVQTQECVYESTYKCQQLNGDSSQTGGAELGDCEFEPECKKLCEEGSEDKCWTSCTVEGKPDCSKVCLIGSNPAKCSTLCPNSSDKTQFCEDSQNCWKVEKKMNTCSKVCPEGVDKDKCLTVCPEEGSTSKHCDREGKCWTIEKAITKECSKVLRVGENDPKIFCPDSTDSEKICDSLGKCWTVTDAPKQCVEACFDENIEETCAKICPVDERKCSLSGKCWTITSTLEDQEECSKVCLEGPFPAQCSTVCSNSVHPPNGCEVDETDCWNVKPTAGEILCSKLCSEESTSDECFTVCPNAEDTQCKIHSQECWSVTEETIECSKVCLDESDPLKCSIVCPDSANPEKLCDDDAKCWTVEKENVEDECLTVSKTGGPDSTKVCDKGEISKPKKYKDSNSCNTYLTCVDKKYIRNKCSPGEYFSITDQDCTTREKAVNECDRCQDTSLMFVNAYNDNCKGYFYCSNGKKEGQGKCDEDYYFNENIQGCTTQKVEFPACLESSYK